jgi:hypothetical protein
VGDHADMAGSAAFKIERQQDGTHAQRMRDSLKITRSGPGSPPVKALPPATRGNWVGDEKLQSSSARWS